MSRTLIAAAVLLLGAAPGFAQTAAPMPGMTMAPAAGSVSPADKEMMDGMARMNQAMTAAPMTGDPDHDFVAMMLPHHQGAIDMAKTELRYGKDPAMKRMARAVIAAQEKEIGEMRAWLAKHASH